MDKAGLRRLLKGRTVPEEAGRKACALLLADPWVREADCVLLYYPLADEADIRPLYGKLACMALPYMLEDGNMDFSIYRGALTEGRFKIKECVEKEAVQTTERTVIVIPALAYDRTGVRLGRGLGCYDRYMAAHRIRSIGIITQDRLYERLPREEHDLRVDRLIIC